MFKSYHRWLKGIFTCMKCGTEYKTMGFGWGLSICPDCYNGEKYAMIYDNSYFLNKVMAFLLKQKVANIESDNFALDYLHNLYEYTDQYHTPYTHRKMD